MVALVAAGLGPSVAQQPEDLQKATGATKAAVRRDHARSLRQRIAAMNSKSKNKKRPTKKQRKGPSLRSSWQPARPLWDSRIRWGKVSGPAAFRTDYDLLNEAESKDFKTRAAAGRLRNSRIFPFGLWPNGKGGRKSRFRLRERTRNTAWEMKRKHMEIHFRQHWLNPEHDGGKAWLKTEVMIEANTANAASYANFPGNTGMTNFV